LINNYGFALESAGRLQDALAAYEKAASLMPEQQTFHNNVKSVKDKMKARAQYDL
jgi:Flp pilus assembly protein TadD